MKKIIKILSVVGLWCCVSLATPVYANDTKDQDLPISEEIVAGPELKIHSHSIEVVVNDDTDHNVAVYALTGQMVRSLIASSGSTIIELGAGYYIVKIDDAAKRVIIR